MDHYCVENLTSIVIRKTEDYLKDMIEDEQDEEECSDMDEEEAKANSLDEEI